MLWCVAVRWSWLQYSWTWKTTSRKALSNLNSFWMTTRISWALWKLLFLGSQRQGCVDKIEGELIVEFPGLSEVISIDSSKCKLSGGDRWGDWDQHMGIELKNHWLVLYSSFKAWYIFPRTFSIVYMCVAVVSVHSWLKSHVNLFFWWKTCLVISVHFGTLRNNATTVHQYFHNFLAGACASLYKLVQALTVRKLPAKPAMSKFWQALS